MPIVETGSWHELFHWQQRRGDGAAGLETLRVRHRYDRHSLAQQLLGTIQDIQYGREPDNPWSVPVCDLPGA